VLRDNGAHHDHTPVRPATTTCTDARFGGRTWSSDAKRSGA
jgi:hypothetical protein